MDHPFTREEIEALVSIVMCYKARLERSKDYPEKKRDQKILDKLIDMKYVYYK